MYNTTGLIKALGLDDTDSESASSDDTDAQPPDDIGSVCSMSSSFYFGHKDSDDDSASRSAVSNDDESDFAPPDDIGSVCSRSTGFYCGHEDYDDGALHGTKSHCHTCHSNLRSSGIRDFLYVDYRQFREHATRHSVSVMLLKQPTCTFRADYVVISSDSVAHQRASGYIANARRLGNSVRRYKLLEKLVTDWIRHEAAKVMKPEEIERTDTVRGLLRRINRILDPRLRRIQIPRTITQTWADVLELRFEVADDYIQQHTLNPSEELEAANGRHDFFRDCLLKGLDKINQY